MKAFLLFLVGLLLVPVVIACGQDTDPALHKNIRATVFWVGEPATEDNGFISNVASAWDGQWTKHYGGVDDPVRRQNQGLWPADFTPAENSFYGALPYGEFTDEGVVKPNAKQVTWYDANQPPVPGQTSILKNHWIRVTYKGKTVYVQWEDVGPFESDDIGYVFGQARPRYSKAGLDLSPAAASYLGLAGSGSVSWKFVDAAQVPSGPWGGIKTTSQVHP